MKDFILLNYVENEKTYSGNLERNEFLEDMKYVRDRYLDNNENAKRLIEIIPTVTELTINNDRNETQDVPIVFFKKYNEAGEEVESGLSILRNHTIIWGFLMRYCCDVKEAQKE